jgi:hypothetical protein
MDSFGIAVVLIVWFELLYRWRASPLCSRLNGHKFLIGNQSKLLLARDAEFLVLELILCKSQPFDSIQEGSIEMLWFDKESVYAVAVDGHKSISMPLEEFLPARDRHAVIQMRRVRLGEHESGLVFDGDAAYWTIN